MNCRRQYWRDDQFNMMPGCGRNCPYGNDDDDFFDCPMRGRMDNNNRCNRGQYYRRNPNCPFR